MELFGSLGRAALGILAYFVLVGVLYALTLLLPKRYRERSQSAVFVGPAVFLLVIGLAIPAVRTIYMSFQTGPTASDFAGFDNYRRLFTDSANVIVLRNNVLWLVFVTFFSVGIGLLIARLVDGMRGESIAKALIFLPMAISLVGAGIIWKFIYAFNGDESVAQIGLLNQVWIWLDPVLPGNQTPQLWLLETPWNTLFLIVVMIWVQTGFAVVLFSAAIKGVDSTLLEAARIDGASERQTFFRVVIPSIRGTIVVVVTTMTIAVLKVFDIVRAMTGGNFETEVIANDMFDKSFREGNPGFGAALATVLFMAVIPIVWMNTRHLRLTQEENA